MTRNFKALIVCVCLSLWASALSAQEHWTFDYRQFQYDMTVYFSLQNGDVMVANPANYEVAAFVGDECRGVAVFEDQIGQNGVALKYGYLKVYSNVESGETIVLKCFDKDVAKERDFADVTLTFQNNSHEGYPSTPLPLVLQYQVEAQSAYADMGTVEGSGIKKSGLSTKVTAIPNEGYKFVRWSNGMTGNPYTFIVEKDVSLTAEFAPKEYTLTFVLDNGQDNIVLKQDYKSIVTAPTGLEKLGFTFNGWDTEVPATTPARDVTFTAQWSRNSYNLKFMSGDEVLSEQSVPYEGEVVTPAANPTKEGYTFTGWSPVVNMTMPAHDQTYTAQFTVNQYKVTFMANGEFVKNIYQDYGSEIVVPDAPTEGGYTFLGWKPDVDAKVPAHDVIYTASYDRNEYYAAFIVDGEVKQKNEVTFGNPIVAPTDPVKEGYTFKGWQPAIPETMPAYDMAFTAKFEVNSYDVTWKVDDKTRVDKVNYLSDIVVPADPVKEGYTFTGWTPEVPSKMPAEDQTFTAQFVVNNYLVKFVIDEDVQEESLAYGTVITATDPVKDGYTFTGWNPELSEGTTVPARDVTYTAQFTVNSYSVTFLLGTDILSTTSQDFGSEIVVPNAPQKVGFTFKEWQPEVPATLPSHDVTFTALYERNSYLSVFVVDGDTLKADSLAYEAKVLPPANPEKVGYTFTGWQPEVLESMPANDVTYTAQFTLNKYLATFVVDGEILQSDSIVFNTAITKPVDPVKTGYTFAGWDPVVPEVISAADMTFTAQWTINQYNVTFIADGETLKSEKQDYGTAIVVPQDPSKVGHSFTGWDPEVPELVPDSDVVFTAQFAPNKYLATFIIDGDTLKSDSIVFNTAIVKPVDPVKTGYTFTGWDPIVPEVISAADMTFSAQFTVNKYNVTFIADGETLKSEKQDYGTAIVAPQAPLKVGHSFTGWDPEVPELVPDSDVVFTALFIPNKYLATFVVDGEILKSDSVLFNTAITKPDDPVKTGYTFTGWDPVVPEVISASDMTFTAQFTVNKYNVTFIADGETLKSEKQDYGTAIVVPQDPSKVGHTFVGWEPEVPELVPDSDVVFTAQFTLNKYLATFVVDGEILQSDSIVFNTAITKPVDPVKTGYTFAGWDPVVPEVISAADMTFTAQWTINQYNVTFIADGETLKSEKQDYGTAIVVPQDPSKVGHTFAGWEPEVPELVPDSDVVFTAQFTLNKYLATFVVDGEILQSDSIVFNTAITKPVDPVKTGYTFAGWDPVVPEVISAADMTFTAQWTINQYNVTFIADGETLKSEKQDYGTLIVAPEVPTKEGYSFAGWDPQLTEGATVPDSAVTYVAVYTVNKYNVIYIVNGQEWAREEVAYGDSIVLREYTPSQGYVFNGWVSDQEYKTMPAHDVIYTANITTGIDALFKNAEYVDVYTISGKLVGRQKTLHQVKQLPRGLYIVNGKRIVVK